MDVQIGRVTLSMDNMYFFGEVHVQDIASVANKYDVPIQLEVRSNTSFPYYYFIMIDGIKFYQASDCERNELID